MKPVVLPMRGLHDCLVHGAPLRLGLAGRLEDAAVVAGITFTNSRTSVSQFWSRRAATADSVSAPWRSTRVRTMKLSSGSSGSTSTSSRLTRCPNVRSGS